MPNDYALAREARKEEPKRKLGMSVQGEDPMRGVTDPRKLLKSDTQRIDKNVITPEQMWDKSDKIKTTGTEIKTA